MTFRICPIYMLPDFCDSTEQFAGVAATDFPNHLGKAKEY